MTRYWSLLTCAVMVSTSLAGRAQVPHAFHPQPATDVLTQFHWPGGKRAAISLTFDDARLSQIDKGLPFLEKENVKVTFYVVPSRVKQRLQGWKTAVAEGHEIANHTLTHPCSGNYFAKNNALEDFTLEKIEREIDGNNEQVHDLLGVTPKNFAYPCGQKFVGRGLDSESYVPLIAERFMTGRGYKDEMPNDPGFFDYARAMGTAFDDMDYIEMKKIVDKAAQNGSWVIFVGHEMGTRAYQTTDLQALKQLCDYLKDPANGFWLGTVEEIGSYVHKQRQHDSRTP